MQARILIIGGILESDEKESLDKIIKTEAIDVVFTHYLTNSQSKNGKKLKAAESYRRDKNKKHLYSAQTVK